MQLFTIIQPFLGLYPSSRIDPQEGCSLAPLFPAMVNLAVQSGPLSTNFKPDVAGQLLLRTSMELPLSTKINAPDVPPSISQDAILALFCVIIEGLDFAKRILLEPASMEVKKK